MHSVELLVYEAMAMSANNPFAGRIALGELPVHVETHMREENYKVTLWGYLRTEGVGGIYV